MRQLSLIDTVWLEVKDGNDTARHIFDQHYSRRHYISERKTGATLLFAGPGEKMVLISPDALALFIWRKFISMDTTQAGSVNCAVFRNEGSQLSSDLIRAAVELAWQKWPGQRLYTYVNASKIRKKRDPGRCFLRAGWNYCGRTPKGLFILELLPT